MQMRILFMFLSILVATGCTEQASDYTANTEVKNEMVWKFKYDDLGLMTSLTGPGDAVTKISYEIDESKHFIKQVTKKHEDSSEVLIANLSEEIQLKYGNANFSELQTARSLLVNRTTRTSEEIKVLSELIQKVDEKMEERKK